MPKRSRKQATKPKPRQKAARARDENESAFDSVQQIVHLTEASRQRQGKNPAAVALGRLGGLKGGKARAEKLSKADRSESARKAANARWKRNA